MGLIEARGQLGKAIKTLSAQWSDTKMNWDDPVSHKLETEFLQPLANDLRMAITAMDQAAIIAMQAERDCE